MTDDNLSMPWGEDSDSSPTVDVRDVVSEESLSEDSLSLDSPVAALNEYGSTDDSTYGSREDDLREVKSEENDGTSDEVEVSKLFNTPTVDSIRWQYRENGLAATVVDKPVKDAFKYDVELDFTDDTTNEDDIREFAKETYIPKQIEARIKSRRDGVSLLFWVVDDTSSVEKPIENPNGVADLRVITIDELAKGHGNPRYDVNHKVADEATAERAAKHTKYDIDQLVVTRSGLVVVDDITSPDHEDFVGVMYRQNPQLSEDGHFKFIHADRLELFVTRPTVDGNMNDSAYGHVEGDSILTPIFHALTGVTKAEWALGQTLLRYTAPLHVVEIDKEAQPKNGDWEEHIEKVDSQLDNLNNKSSLTLPPAHSAKTLTADGEIDPEPFLDGLINDICAGGEITRSVLLGTQAGTVSGSSTDAKNYYNQVERNRTSHHTDKLKNGISRYMEYTNKSGSLENLEWGPLFKVDDVKRMDGMMTLVSAISNSVGKYLLSVEEARDLLQQQWAEFDVDVDLDELSEEDMDMLDRVNTTKGKQFAGGEETPEDEYESKHLGNNGGGRQQGQSDDPQNPTTDKRGRSSTDSDPQNPTTE